MQFVVGREFLVQTSLRDIFDGGLQCNGRIRIRDGETSCSKQRRANRCGPCSPRLRYIETHSLLRLVSQRRMGVGFHGTAWTAGKISTPEGNAVSETVTANRMERSRQSGVAGGCQR